MGHFASNYLLPNTVICSVDQGSKVLSCLWHLVFPCHIHCTHQYFMLSLSLSFEAYFESPPLVTWAYFNEQWNCYLSFIRYKEFAEFIFLPQSRTNASILWRRLYQHQYFRTPRRSTFSERFWKLSIQLTINLYITKLKTNRSWIFINLSSCNNLEKIFNIIYIVNYIFVWFNLLIHETMQRNLYK